MTNKKAQRVRKGVRFLTLWAEYVDKMGIRGRNATEFVFAIS